MGQTSYYHYDGLGSTQLLTDENGTITDSYANTAFGEPVDTGAENPTPNPFQFVGQLGYYLDSDTGNYYVRRVTIRLCWPDGSLKTRLASGAEIRTCIVTLGIAHKWH